MSFLVKAILALSCLLCTFTSVLAGFVTEDIYVPTDCDGVVKAGDHLLLEYSLIDPEEEELYALRPPNHRLYIVVLEDETSVVHKTLKGMCRSATRKIIFDSPPEEESLAGLDTGYAMDQIAAITLEVVHLTDHQDFEIFSHLGARDSGKVSLMLAEKQGSGAVNEWGYSALMFAVEMEVLSCFSYLLNTRMPMVDVNFAKPSGHTAIFYAVVQKTPVMLRALLLRGADATVALLESKMTALHLACKLERLENVKVLLQYGADSEAVDAQGLMPLQYLPRDNPRGIRLKFKKAFEQTSVHTERPRRIGEDEF